jgi:hypothetical protein
VSSRRRRGGLAASLLRALALGALLALVPLSSGQAAGPTRDDAGTAIERVRDQLRSRGRPSKGPMEVAILQPYDPPAQGRRAWIVLSDDGVWLVWGAISGPLGPDEARMLLAVCMCDFTLSPLAGSVGRGATEGF